MNGNITEIRQKVESWFDLHSNEMIEDLGKMLAVKSVRELPQEGEPYGHGPREALSLAASMLKERGFEVSEFENIIITADYGPEPPKMGILAHIDVVDAGEGWVTEPYGITITDGKIFGRGALDNKGPSIAAMYAMYCARDICPDMRSGFRLILGSGEEVGCEDIALYLKKNEPPQYVFTPDAEYPLVNIEKGRAAIFFSAAWDKDPALPHIVSITGGKTINVVPNRAEAVIEGLPLSDVEAFCREYSLKTGADMSAVHEAGRIVVNAEGKASHAAMPELGLNAQTALIEMLAAMPFAESKGFKAVRALNRLFPHGDYLGRALGIAMGDKDTGKLTANFGVLRYSETEMAGNFDSRTPACTDEVDLLDMIRAVLRYEGITMTNSVLSKCHYTPEDSPFVQTLLRIYRDYTGNPGGCLGMGGQTYVHEIPGGVAFGCALPEIDSRIHGANEFIGVEQLIVSAKMFAHSIIDMCMCENI